MRLRSSATRSDSGSFSRISSWTSSSTPSEQFDGIVGIEFADTLGHGFRLQFLEQFLADGVVDFVERREVEIGAGQLDQGRALVGIEGFDQVTEIGLVQLADDLLEECGIGNLNRVRDRLDKFGANVAVIVAHRHLVERRQFLGSDRLGEIDVIGHAAPRLLVWGVTELALSCRKCANPSVNRSSHQALPNAQCLMQSEKCGARKSAAGKVS